MPGRPATGQKTTPSSPASFEATVNALAREQARQMVRKPNPTITIGPDPQKKHYRPSCVRFTCYGGELEILESYAESLYPDSVETDIQEEDSLPLPWWDSGGLNRLMLPVGTWELMYQFEGLYTAATTDLLFRVHTKNSFFHQTVTSPWTTGNYFSVNISGSTYGLPQNWLDAGVLGDIIVSLDGTVTFSSWAFQVTVVRLSEKQWNASYA